MTLRERLRPRLLLSHISLATIPVLIIGIMLIQTTRESIETTVSDGNFEIAKRASNEIRLYIEQAQSVVSQVADDMGILETTPIQRQRLIDNVVVRHEQFRELAVLDLEGRELLCTRLAEHDAPHLRDDLILPQSESISISQVFISEDRLPSVQMTVPILRFNQIIGYVTAEVNLKDMWDLVDSVQIGGDNDSGYGNAYVVSGNGRLIAHPQRERVYGQEDLSDRPVGMAITEAASNTVLYQTQNGELLAAFVEIEPLGWHVVIEQPTAEAFTRSQEAKVEVTVLIIFSAIAASLIGVFFARKIAHPVSELVRGAHLFGKGELTQSIDVPGHGELTMLADEFNHMARQLLEKERQLQRVERLATLSKFASILSHDSLEREHDLVPLACRAHGLLLGRHEFVDGAAVVGVRAVWPVGVEYLDLETRVDRVGQIRPHEEDARVAARLDLEVDLEAVVLELLLCVQVPSAVDRADDGPVLDGPSLRLAGRRPAV